MMATPLQRLRAKTSTAALEARNEMLRRRAVVEDHHPAEEHHPEDADFWRDFASELEDLGHELETHARSTHEHSRRANKLAEVVRTVKVTKKAAGRDTPNKVHYIQTITKQSDTPFRKT